MPQLFATFTIAAIMPLASNVPAAATTLCSSIAACIMGTNSSTGSGVTGSSSSGFGVSGISKSDHGVDGTSASSFGVVGRTTENSTSDANARSGVLGEDSSTNKKGFNAGVFGTSSYGTGAEGQSAHGVGVVATANTTALVGFATEGCTYSNGPCASPLTAEFPTGAAINAGTDAGGLGLNVRTDLNPNLTEYGATGIGAEIIGGDVGLYVSGGVTESPALIATQESPGIARGDGVPAATFDGPSGMSATGAEFGVSATAFDSAFFAQAGGTGSYLFLGSDSSGRDVASLDDKGNLILAGALTQKGSPATSIVNSDGSRSTTYTARNTTPIIEDEGESRLTSGRAYVQIDLKLQLGLDTSHGYLVFITPQGPVSGLYVDQKNAHGFYVREFGPAHDSIVFDYRIVARPYGDVSPRLPRTTDVLTAFTKRPKFYSHVRAPRLTNGKVDVKSLPRPMKLTAP